MKKIYSLSLLLGAAVAFTGCVNEEDDIFDQSAAERLNAASELYSSRLEAQPNGWAIQLYPTTENEAPFGSGYLLLLDFDADHSVKAAMNNSLTANRYLEARSAWEVLTDNGPVLSFNSHNDVIHLFSDPNDVTSTSDDDETGTGIGGDYEFVIVDAPEDASYMMLKGKKRGTYNLMTPVEEGVDYESYLADVNNFMQTMFPENAPTFNLIHFGDSIYKMEGANDGIPNIYPYGADAIVDESFNPFLITKRGDDYYLRFRDVQTFNGGEVQEFKYNTSSDVFESTVDSSYFIGGDDPQRFFFEAIDATTNYWLLNSSSEKSDGFAALYDAAAEELRNSRYTLQNVRLGYLASQSCNVITVNIRTSRGSSSQNYKVDVLNTNGKIVISNYEPLTTSAETILNTIPSLKTLLDSLTGEFTATPGNTAFDLRTIKLTNSNNDWFVYTLN